MTSGLKEIGIVGAGTMGAGIAQVMAEADLHVRLYDLSSDVAEEARDAVRRRLQRKAERGVLDVERFEEIASKIVVTPELDGLASCDLIIEAVAEDIEIKSRLFRSLEGICRPDTVFATNTSSLSITEIAARVRKPERVVGLHFFNPAPVMKLIEVVSGLQTAPEVVSGMKAFATAIGKEPVVLPSTPGFLVNRIARPFYAEALRIREEGFASYPQIDAALSKGAGFRMGPFALMDLIGNDVNSTVTKSVFDALFHDPRFRPSLLQQEYVNAGWYGRKSGRGFYNYEEGVRTEPLQFVDPRAHSLKDFDIYADRTEVSGAILAVADGRTARQRSLDEGRPVILRDYLDGNSSVVSLARAPSVTDRDFDGVVGAIQSAGLDVMEIGDCPGLIVMRTLSMLANEAFDTVQNGVCGQDEADRAMTHGANYPRGPIAWARQIGLESIAKTLSNIRDAYGGDVRYRVSLGLSSRLHDQLLMNETDAGRHQ